jgi:hypothetical protein
VEKQREIAVNALHEGFTVEVISRLTGLSIEEVQQQQLIGGSNSTIQSF